jgi:hypothetical protein
MIQLIDKNGNNYSQIGKVVVIDKDGKIKSASAPSPGSGGFIRRNAQYGNINYCGFAPNGSLENQAVWTITKITVATNGSVTTTTSNNVTWTSVPF